VALEEEEQPCCFFYFLAVIPGPAEVCAQLGIPTLDEK
jgi:hypothetical protein